jgi:dihydropteroate synthase
VGDEQMLVQRVSQMLEDGADVLDVGACSTRPGSQSVDAAGEMERLHWALNIIRRVAPGSVISVDTYRADVAQRCVEEWGGDIINDISGGTLDEAMFSTVARLHVPYVLMHMRGTPATMASMTQYDNVAAEVLEWMARRIDQLRQMGVADVIADPGFGFAKTLEQNYELLRKLDYLKALDLPILVGVSRKSMITKVLDVAPAEALNGTTVLHTLALAKGANILRVHDVKEARQVITLYRALQKAPH